jgi:minor extracellular serine protease Vpr
LRRWVVPIAVAAALAASALPASAALQPIQRTFGGLTIPLVRHGTVHVPPASERGRARVIVTLGLPPLADALTPARTTTGRGGRRRLDVHASSSRAYLARVEAVQARAVRTLKRAIPAARVQERYRVVLDGMTVDLPEARLPALYQLGFVRKVYPSLRYSLNLNRSTSIIGAPQLQAATGASGAGIKVAVVDDGVDQKSPFLAPDGLAYPAGFPKGITGYTSPKVIVARNFPAPQSTTAGRLPVDRDSSFHATFVAGVIAGDPGTTAPAATAGDCEAGGGRCHPAVSGLGGVAPRAWIGNYRVFNTPTPLGGCCEGNTPEIVAAFEAAVKDGMDVINFSGGGSQSDPATDALIPAVANVTKAGVVAVISAGNDRDLFGLGTVGSPSTAPDAISVGAVTNTHVFGQALTLDTPDVASLKQVEIVPAPGGIPASWATTGHPVVDVGAIAGTGARRLCAVSGNRNDRSSTPLPSGSLQGAIALVWEGGCSFDSKAARAVAAGAIGMILVDAVPGDANGLQVQLSLPTGTIADIDGAHLSAALAGSGGRGVVRISTDTQEIVTNRGGIPTSFSSAGPTAYGHMLKPDLSAPGAQIVSATLPEFASSGFAVLDGTSFSAPHVSGGAALLLQLHPGWTPAQVKSALMSTAGPVFGDSAQTTEASVLVEGAGLANLPRAADPKLFTSPQSLSFQFLDTTGGAASRSLLVTLTDAGGGSGDWQVTLQPQSASPGSSVDVASSVALAPGGQATVEVTARAAAGAPAGDDYGFVVLTRGDVTRRIPYYFSVAHPALAGATVIPLKATQTGTTATGVDRAQLYRWPSNPFGVTGLLGIDQPIAETGKEKVYAIDLKKRAVNFGVVVTSPRPELTAGIDSLFYANAPIQPWLLASLNENDVMGDTGIPVNANSLLPDYLVADGAAGSTFLAPGRYYVVVDSGADPFSGRQLGGKYVLRSWVNDTKPPRVRLLTKTVPAGRPTIVARMTDAGSGVDPLSLLVITGSGQSSAQIGATMFDPATGLAVFSIPRSAKPLLAGSNFVRLVAADYQEAKNAYTVGNNLLPNTTFQTVQLKAVARPTVTWLAPSAGACVRGRALLQVVANGKARVSSVIFYDGPSRKIARVTKNTYGIFRTRWATGAARPGKHVLTAVVADVSGRESRASLPVRVCR